MIDQAYQAEIDKNLDDQQKRPSQTPAPAIPLWQNFWSGLGGLVAGPNQAAGAWADILHADSEVLASTGTTSRGGMFAVPSDEEVKQNNAAHDRIMARGLDMNSATGAQLRTTAKEFMPDPQSTGKAGVILGGLTDFGSQAIPAAAAGPAGLVALATERGIQKSEDLKEQGVDVNTRTAAGIVSGTFDAASMVLPMTGGSRLIAAGKGAAGGAATSVAQTEAEKLILQHGGYDKLASTYDPFDPVSIALSSLVPAAFGALHSPSVAKAPGAARVEPTHADVTLTPEEQAHSDAAEAASLDTDIASIQREIASQKDAGAKAVLQTELERLQKQKSSGGAAPAPLDPNVEAAARVHQTADALNASRLSPDDDLLGAEQHQQAVEAASDQIARGAPVEVSDILGDPRANFERWFGESRIRDEQGNPQVMYHGTAADVDSFVGKQANSIFVADHPIVGQAYAEQSAKWLKEHGQEGAPNILPVYVRAEKPFDFENHQHVDAVVKRAFDETPTHTQGDGQKALVLDGKNTLYTKDVLRQALKDGEWNLIETPEIQAAIKAEGHDSFFVNEEGFKNLGLHSPNQLKSAIGNSGRFDLTSGSLTDPLGNFARAIDELRSARAPEEGAAQPNHAAFKEAQAEGAAPEAPREASPAAGKVPDDAAAHPGPEADHLDAATTEILRANPDLMVQLDGMEHPVRAEDLLKQIREEAAQEAKDGSLLEVAAQCAISL